jgi:hypothetical protein
MDILLISILAGLFLGMLFLNVYFRVKVFKAYKVLVQNKIEFNFSHVMNDKKMEAEVLNKYPEHQEHIRAFVHHMKYSIQMATVLMVLITAVGAVLMYYR